MQIKADCSLKTFNTFGVEARADSYVRFDSVAEIIAFLKHRPSIDPCRLVLGAGSNVLFVDDFKGTIVHPALKGIRVIESNRRHVKVKAMAGEAWDDLVDFAVANGWGGIENLSLIPGSVGASVVQNIGAYGVEVAAVIDRVEAIAIHNAKPVRFRANACGFAYRSSNFKVPWKGRFIITAVVFRLSRAPEFVLDYPGVLTAVKQLGRTDLRSVRQAIVSIRRHKLPNPADMGNAGSFFKNPVVDRGTCRKLLRRFPDLPHYPQDDDRFKLPAAWLIEQCGWKGRRLGRAGVHERHALVLVNLGGATGLDILELSRRVQADVRQHFAIDLEPEVQIIGPNEG